jgi:signal peptide peptidase SppA
MEQASYDAMMDQVALLIGANQYEAVAKASREAAESPVAPYTVENGVARFTVEGPMSRYPTSLQSAVGGTATLPLGKAIRDASVDGFVNGAFFEIDSPGGTVTGLSDLAAEIARFRAVKPVAMHIVGMGASAAYRAAIEGDFITMDPMGVAGSVGAMTKMRDSSELMKRAGVKDHYIASGDRKTAGAPGTEVTPEQLAERQKFIDGLGESFVQSVMQRRPQTTEQIDDIRRAGIYGASDALSAGLIDAVMTLDQSFTQFASRIPFGMARSLPGKV